MLGSKPLLALKVDCGNVIGLNYELAPEQVIPLYAKTMYYHSHLLLLNRISPLSVIKLPALEDNGMVILHQDTID